MPFSFIHASDLQLGAPLFSVAELPDELRGCILDARFSAARRVFDLAIREQVDSVLFAGGVLASSAGPRAMWFLAQQCERLEAAGIDVVWSEAPSDRRWPEFVPLPRNVCLTSPDVGQFYELSNGQAAVLVLTAVAPRKSLTADTDLLRIGILPNAAAQTQPDLSAADYWALGGRSQPGAVPVEHGLAQFSGTTQGTRLEDLGPRGCLLVHADDQRNVRSRFVPTAGFEWREECIRVSQGDDWETVRGRLMERFHDIARAATCEAVLLRWVLRGHGIVWRQLLRDDVSTQLLQDLRSEFSATARPVWSLFVEAVSDGTQVDDLQDVEAALGVSAADRPAAVSALRGVEPAHLERRGPNFERLRDQARRQTAVRR